MIKNLKICGLLLSLALMISCGSLREVGGQSANGSGASNPAAKSGGAVKVPGNLKNAERDAALNKDGALIVTLPNNSDILYRSEAQKLSVDELGKKFDEYADAAESRQNASKTVYVIAAAENDYESIVKVLELARRKRIETARLVVSRNESGAPTEVFEVMLDKEPLRDKTIRPNPSMLVATLLKDGGYRLNMEDVTLDRLKTWLPEIFRNRENMGVFREGSNEVEQTVQIKAPLSAKYEDVARLIDAVKETGANPIVVRLDELEQ